MPALWFGLGLVLGFLPAALGHLVRGWRRRAAFPIHTAERKQMFIKSGDL